MDFNLLSSNEWMRKMKNNSMFYGDHARDATEMKLYEDLLLKLAANFLKRTFKLIPILEEDTEHTFQPMNYSSGPFYIAYCNSLRHRNFFISVFPKTGTAR